MCLLPLLSPSAKLAPEHEGSLASQGDSVLYVPLGHGDMAPTPKATSQSGVGHLRVTGSRTSIQRNIQGDKALSMSTENNLH